MTVRADDITFRDLGAQPLIRTAATSEVADIGDLQACISMIELHHPGMEDTAAISTRHAPGFEQDRLQPLPLSLFVEPVFA